MNLGLGFSLGGLYSAGSQAYYLADDGYGGWDMIPARVGYQLADDGYGGWNWSATPSYRLNLSTLLWE